MDGRSESSREPPGVLYRLKVDGRLGEARIRWLEAEEWAHSAGTTVLDVRVADQAELYGRLRRIADLNLRLLSCRRLEPDAETGTDSDSDTEPDTSGDSP